MSAKGCIYWDESSRGYHNNPGHTQYTRGRWCAEKYIDGRRIRRRSKDIDKCLDFLSDCTIVEKRKPNDTVIVPTIHDTRFMVLKDCKATMEQRKQMLRERIEQAEMTLRYFETRDFTEINNHIEKVLLPRLNVYCRKNLAIAKDMRSVILECVGILYAKLNSDAPIFCYENRLRSMLRYYKKHNDLGYYNNIPEPVHEAVSHIDISALEKKFVVRRSK